MRPTGKALYYSYGCYACHGYNGETGYRAFVGNWGHLANEQVFITFLRGRANVAPVTPSDRDAEFQREGDARQTGQGYLRLYPDVQELRAKGQDPTLSAIVEAAKREKN